MRERSGRPSGTTAENASGAATHRNQDSEYATGLDQAMSNAGTDWWTQGAMLAIRQLALTGRGFDADHVLDLVGQPTDPHYPGVVFAAAQRAKIIEAVGCRVAPDGRLLRVWWGRP